MSIDGLGNLRPLRSVEGQDRLQGVSAERAGQLDGASDGDGDDAMTLVPSNLSRYVAAVRSAPSAHHARVAALKAVVADGTYQVPIDALAKRLLGDGN